MALIVFNLVNFVVQRGKFPWQDELANLLAFIMSDCMNWIVWLMNRLLLGNWNIITYFPRLTIWTWKWLRWKPPKPPNAPSQRKIERMYKHVDMLNPYDLQHSSGLMLHPKHQFMIDSYSSYWKTNSDYLWQDISKDFYFINLANTTSPYPPEGYILEGLMILLMAATIGIILIRGYMGILISLVQKTFRIQPEPKPPDPVPNNPKPKEVNTMKVFTSIYSSKDIETLKGRVYFDSDAETCVIDNAANRHIWNEKKDFNRISPPPNCSCYCWWNRS
jgi:hypothetical protein